MSDLSTEILDFLEGAGLIGGGTGWTKAAEFLPPSPDAVLAVFETPGLPPEIVSEGSTETSYDQPGFQVRLRAAKGGQAAMRAKMAAVFAALHGVSIPGSTDTKAHILVRAVQSGPMPMGLDEQARPGITWNFVTIRER